MFLSLINLVRLVVLALICLVISIFNKNFAVFYFLKLAGPSFIKLGQSLSVRPDLVGKKLATVLSEFQDKIKPFSARIIKKIIDKEFAENFDKIFIEFDFNAVASASIAQVHKAKLINGDLVAIKIIRPNIAKRFHRDIGTLKILTKITKPIFSNLSKFLSDILKILNNTTKSELDLLHEAANASRMRDNLKDLTGFYIPKIYWQFSSKRILVLEWVEGVAFSDIEKIRNSRFDAKNLAKNLVISYFNQVYVDGFFHADMHPGNLILRENGDIAAIDFGIVGVIDKKTRIAVAEILIGFLNKDYNKIAKIHIENNLVDKNTNLHDLSISCQKIGEKIIGSDVKDISLAELLASLIEMMNEYKMDSRPELMLLQKTLLLVEGVGVSLDSDLNMWDLARPWVKNWASKNIGFDAKIRDFLFDFLEIAKNFLTKK